jgi:copper homeostasis protein
VTTAQLPVSYRPPAIEVIATTLEDARAAERGGADRLELVAAMAADGLLPDLALVTQVHSAVALPVRVMLRSRPGFGTDTAELAALCHAAERLRAAGVEEFVFGFLTEDGKLDAAALLTLHAAAAPRRWTLHRAFDQVVDAEQAWAACRELPGLDLVLTAGSHAGVPDGMEQLCRRAAWQTAGLHWLAGGGLRSEHVPRLRAAGITQFHSGRAVRRGRSWAEPVDETLVRQLKQAVLG